MPVTLERETKETKIKVTLDANVETACSIDIPCGFMEHMLSLFTFHSGLSLQISGNGDTKVDYHHIIEDLGIVLGRSFLEMFRTSANSRYGWNIIPMDGSLVMTSLDISGRSKLVWELDFPTEKCGDFDLELIREFWEAFVREARITLHVHKIVSDNSHHLAEALFKSLGKSFKQAMVPCGSLQSTKGSIL